MVFESFNSHATDVENCTGARLLGTLTSARLLPGGTDVLLVELRTVQALAQACGSKAVDLKLCMSFQWLGEKTPGSLMVGKGLSLNNLGLHLIDSAYLTGTFALLPSKSRGDSAYRIPDSKSFRKAQSACLRLTIHHGS